MTHSTEIAQGHTVLRLAQYDSLEYGEQVRTKRWFDYTLTIVLSEIEVRLKGVEV